MIWCGAMRSQFSVQRLQGRGGASGAGRRSEGWELPLQLGLVARGRADLGCNLIYKATLGSALRRLRPAPTHHWSMLPCCPLSSHRFRLASSSVAGCTSAHVHRQPAPWESEQLRRSLETLPGPGSASNNGC